MDTGKWAAGFAPPEVLDLGSSCSVVVFLRTGAGFYFSLSL